MRFCLLAWRTGATLGGEEAAPPASSRRGGPGSQLGGQTRCLPRPSAAPTAPASPRFFISTSRATAVTWSPSPSGRPLPGTADAAEGLAGQPETSRRAPSADSGSRERGLAGGWQGPAALEGRRWLQWRVPGRPARPQGNLPPPRAEITDQEPGAVVPSSKAGVPVSLDFSHRNISTHSADGVSPARGQGPLAFLPEAAAATAGTRAHVLPRDPQEAVESASPPPCPRCLGAREPGCARPGGPWAPGQSHGSDRAPGRAQPPRPKGACGPGAGSLLPSGQARRGPGLHVGGRSQTRGVDMGPLMTCGMSSKETNSTSSTDLL